MSSKTTTPSEILLDISISNKKNKKNKNHSKQRKNIENKENISLNIIKEVDEEESSAKNLKSILFVKNFLGNSSRFIKSFWPILRA